jgi:hypothetical protein
MAVVRITKQLTEDILARAKGKFSDRIRAAEESVPNSERWGDYVYEKLLGKHIPIMEQLPMEFFNIMNNIQVNRVGDQGVNIRFKLSTNKRWPLQLPSDAPAEKNSYGSYVALNSDPVWDELHAEVVAWRTRCSNIRTQASEFTEGVSKVLSSYSTLAPALKAWPPLWELLPEYAKNKHKEIVERTKPDREAPTLDTNKLTAIMAASKIGGL